MDIQYFDCQNVSNECRLNLSASHFLYDSMFTILFILKMQDQRAKHLLTNVCFVQLQFSAEKQAMLGHVDSQPHLDT